jgi:hypothetical protein
MKRETGFWGKGTVRGMNWVVDRGRTMFWLVVDNGKDMEQRRTLYARWADRSLPLPIRKSRLCRSAGNDLIQRPIGTVSRPTVSRPNGDCLDGLLVVQY